MAKKKSKTQKYKKNQKKKIQKNQNNILIQKEQPTKQIKVVKEENKIDKTKQLVDRKKVDYNVILNNKNYNQKKDLQKTNKENKKEVINKIQQASKKKNIIIRLFYEIIKNLHIIFNAIIITTFILLLVGLIRIQVLEKGTIIYISAIILFLMAVAISYNKYMSGKIFTIILTIGMGFGIYHMQYTYDFIRNLNSNMYEYKTYYVVTFDNGSNRSIYNINNKKVGLLVDNCINIERILNTKLDKVNYLEYKDINELFKDFYNQKFRAILVNENQYKYLKNNIEPNSRDIKILYEFQANAKK